MLFGIKGTSWERQIMQSECRTNEKVEATQFPYAGIEETRMDHLGFFVPRTESLCEREHEDDMSSFTTMQKEIRKHWDGFDHLRKRIASTAFGTF